MCGLTGLLIREECKTLLEVQEVIQGMTRTLTSRGPDAFGHILHSPIAFGHRRLSILELSDAGAQPMRIGIDSPILTYNGEVYNFRDLRTELEAMGCTFRGHSDTEVILQVYIHWGLSGLKRLEGIFALALWDSQQQRLVLMRDRFGVKPLFYGESSYGLAFGSEIKAVIAASGVDTSLDDQSLSEYLWYGTPHGERTFYKGVRAIEPGHWLIIENGKRRLEAWWQIEEWLTHTIPPANTPEEGARQVRDVLDQSVKRQLVADVPVGVFLSGGVDSSAIAASAIHTGAKGLRSYTAGFDFDRGVNELPKAAQVAKHLGLNHHELQISGNDLSEVLLTLAQAHDEPFADAANIPLYLMCRRLAGEIKVVLQGDGGDELFAGYRRYAILRNTHWWRLWPQTLSPLIRASGHLGQRFARMADSVGNPDPAMRMAFLLTLETLHRPPEAVFLSERQRELTETTDPFLAYRKAAERFHDYEPVQQMLLTDLTVQLPCQFLTKVDRATMAAGIEARVPLLDEQLARLAINLPSTWKTKGTEKKVILRQSQRERLPNNILDGPKTGFGVPYDYWLRSSLYDFARERLLDDTYLQYFHLDRVVLERMLVQHREKSAGQGFMLWKLLQMALFINLRKPHKLQH